MEEDPNLTEPLPDGWKAVTEDGRDGCFTYYQRTDGFYVYHCIRDQYYSNPLNPRCRMWAAFDKKDIALCKYFPRSRLRTRRKWGSAEAAIKAVNKEIPL